MIRESITELYLPYPGKDDRLVRAYVPAHEEGEVFPVVYMTDGQNVLDEETSTFGCWHTPEAIAAERADSGQAAIIVAIHSTNDPKERAEELTPREIGAVVGPEELLRGFEPAGEVFDRFVTEVVRPAVEAQFPVIRGRNGAAVCGSSSGGLEVFYTALKHPDTFCAAGVFSPAFMFFSTEDIGKWVLSRLQEDMPYLYLYSGGSDEPEQMILQCTEDVYDILSEIYPSEQLSEVILPEQKHHESAWELVFREFLHLFLTRRGEL